MLHLLQSEFTPPCTVLASVPFFPIALGVAPSKSACTPYNSVQKRHDFVDCQFYITPFSTSPSTSTANTPCIPPSTSTANTPCNASSNALSTSLSTSLANGTSTANNEALSNHIALSIEENLTKPHCAIDSMQIWIPIATSTMSKRQYEKATPIQLIDCHYDKELLNDALLLASTGAVVRENPPYIRNDKHLSYQTGYAFKQMSVGNQAVSYISIGLHSKLLDIDYFKSINSETIFKLWQAIQEQGVINITYENFLQCYVHQVDLKTDSIQDDVNASLDIIEANIKESRGFKRFDKKMNQGIQVGMRKDNQVSIHFYNKALQFFNDTRSSIFLEKVLRFNHPSNILRTEITLYAKQLYDDFEIEGEKLFHPSSQMNLTTVLTKLETRGKDVMKKHLTNLFNPQRVNKVNPSDNDKQQMDKHESGIARLVEICLASAMDLNETENAVIDILHPGINKKREVLRLTRHFYTVQSKAIDLDAEVKQVINM